MPNRRPRYYCLAKRLPHKFADPSNAVFCSNCDVYCWNVGGPVLRRIPGPTRVCIKQGEEGMVFYRHLSNTEEATAASLSPRAVMHMQTSLIPATLKHRVAEPITYSAARMLKIKSQTRFALATRLAPIWAVAIKGNKGS